MRNLELSTIKESSFCLSSDRTMVNVRFTIPDTRPSLVFVNMKGMEISKAIMIYPHALGNTTNEHQID